MAQTLKPLRIHRSIFIQCRRYCDKSVYQKDEEGPKPRMAYGKPYPEWRKPWVNREGEWNSKLSLFVTKNPNMEILNTLQQVPNLTWQKVKDWWANIKETQEIENQKFLPERVAALGSNLAALHFFTYRGCRVRMKNSAEWIHGDPLTLKLPDRYQEGYFVEAVDASNFHHNGIRYEGLENLCNLNFLKWLSLKNQKYVDVWCLDRVAGQNGKSLEYLDISGCQFSVGCIYAVARMRALKYLVITDPGNNMELQAAVSMLEEGMPKLLVKAVEPDIETTN